MNAVNLNMVKFSGVEISDDLLFLFLNFSKTIIRFAYASNFNCKRFAIKESFSVKHLKLSRCQNLSELLIDKVNEHLETVDLAECPLMTVAVLKPLLDFCPNLSELNISETAVSDAELDALKTEYPCVNFISKKIKNSPYFFYAIGGNIVEEAL